MRKIKIEVVERAGWWQVKVCGLRHSRYRSRAAARHGAKLLAVRDQASSRAGRTQLGQCLRVAHASGYLRLNYQAHRGQVVRSMHCQGK